MEKAERAGGFAGKIDAWKIHMTCRSSNKHQPSPKRNKGFGWVNHNNIIWVCLKMGYTPNYSHLVGIMISKTIGFRGALFSDTPI